MPCCAGVLDCCLSCGWGASEDYELLPCRWVVFDSPAEVPFKYGNMAWIRNGGCQCSCADMAAFYAFINKSSQCALQGCLIG